MIIGLAGKAGSGKDTAADALVERRGFVKISLAGPLKRICAEVFGWDAARLYGPSELRNEPDPAWDGLTARYALQALGTDWGRRMHPDVWVRACLRQAARHPAACVPDVRFANEADAIRKAGGKVVRITRPGAGLPGDAGAHASEQQDFEADLELPNTGALRLLQARACQLPGVLFGGNPFGTESK